jgi:hypothetical protein
VTGRPLISATLIAKNEKDNVRRCLDALWPHVDEVCVADNGSTDGTIAEFRRYATQHKEPKKIKTVRVTECNDENGDIKDFSSARQAADDLATGEWVIWCDMDDEILGLDRLREMAAGAGDDIGAFFCHYQYAQDGDGNTVSELWRERLVRHDGTRWQGRLHEHKIIMRPVVQVDPSVARWVHHRDHTQRTGERNLRILEAWDRDEPGTARIIQSIAMEYLGMERHAEAADTFARYLACPGEPPDRRAQSTRHMCVMLLIQNRIGEARAAALQSLSETWGWADTHLTLAEVAQTVGRPDEGYVHAKQALELGKPNSLLILNPLQYTAHPLALMSLCLGQMGRLDEAVEKLDECLRIAPNYPLGLQQQPQLRSALRKNRTALAWLANAETLVEAGEPIKARQLLDLAPWYVAQDGRLIARRGELSRLIADRSVAPAKVEDPDADAFAEKMAA